MNKKYILASKSPRRQELLSKVIDYFKIVVPDVDEFIENVEPHQVPEELAIRKAKNVFSNHKDCIIISADTIVLCDNIIFGKPKSREDAISMLRRLSSNTHEVITGCCILSKDKMISFSKSTKVTFRNLTDEDIMSYVDTSEPFDKAGAYGYQGKGYFLVDYINGDYYDVVGLPIGELKERLKEF